MSERVFNALRLTLFASIIVLGSFSLIRYMDVPVHQSVLLSDAGRQAITEACSSGGIICRGFYALVPFVQQCFIFASPFLGYAVLSLLLFGVIAFLQYMKHGEWAFNMRLKPWHFIGVFVLALWILFTTLTFGGGEEPITIVYEPVPQVYVGAGEEGLLALQENFAELKDAGCLTQIGQTGVGSGVFSMSRLCMQKGFLLRVLPHVLIVLYLFFIFAVLGRFTLRLLLKDEQHPFMEWVLSTGLGACGLILILWLVAVIGGLLNQPIYSITVGWVLMLALPIVFWRQSLYWLTSLHRREWQYSAPLYGVVHIIFWVLLSLLVLNFLNVIRPFPIGWDDLGRYLNAPRLLVSYGLFIPQLSVYQWEYITSLSYLLFGYESVFSATAAMVINWSAGLLAVISIYAFARRFFGKGAGLLSALLYYVLPLVGHFSFADMKVDNAVFALGMLATIAFFMGLFPSVPMEEEDVPENQSSIIAWRWIFLAGILAGFAFSLKATNIMTIMMLGTVLFGVAVHWTAFVGAMCMAWFVFARMGQLNFAAVSERVYGSPDVLNAPLMEWALLFLGLGLLGYSAYLYLPAFKKTAMVSGVFIGAFLVSIAPWLLSNNIAAGNAIPRLALTAPNEYSAEFVIAKGAGDPPDHGQPLERLPEELRIDQSKCVATSKGEELDRYWGYGSGWGHYFGLPWRSVMNLDSAGYYVTTYPALILFPLLLLVPFLWMRSGRWLRWLTLGTFFVIAQWVVFGNGVPWYGIAMFMGLCIGLEGLVARSPDRMSQIAASVFIVVSVMIGFSNRFWQYGQQVNIFEFAMGKVSAEAMRERTIPHYDDIREMIEERREAMPNQPYTYRIGTFIPYFIPKNLEVLPVADHQLDMFNCMYQDGDPALMVKRLQVLGFNSIIFDTNTHTIEADPNGSLHQKVQKFVDFVNAPGTGLKLQVNDPGNGVAFILIPPLAQSPAETEVIPSE